MSTVDTEYTDAVARKLQDALELIREWWPETTSPSTARAARGRRPKPGPRPPLPHHVVEARAHAEASLVGWALLLVEEGLAPRPSEPLPPDQVAWWLQEHIYPLSTHEAGGDAAEEVMGHAQAMWSIACPPAAEWRRVGSCPLTRMDGERCDGKVLGRAPREDEEPQVRQARGWLRCLSCHEEGVLDWWESKGLETTPSILTTTEVCELAHRQYGRKLPGSTVRRWALEGRVRPIEPSAKPLRFHRDEIVDVLTEMC